MNHPAFLSQRTIQLSVQIVSGSVTATSAEGIKAHRFAGESLIALSQLLGGSVAQKNGPLSRTRLQLLKALGWASPTTERSNRRAVIWAVTPEGLAHISTVRAPIRKLAQVRDREQRTRAISLSVPLRGPQPSETVRAALSAAAKQRKKADIAIDSHARKNFILQAKRWEDVAELAWSRQQDEHWATLTDLEIMALADARDDPLMTVQTEVPDWVRDENGALVKGDDGLPTLRFENAKARRRKTGLEHVRAKTGDNDRPIMSDRQYEVGCWYGEICAQEAISGLGGREETGLGAQVACKPSPGPADWKLEAIADKKLADYRLRLALGEIEGVAMINLLTAICFEGQTPRQYAGGREREGIRVEERLLIGLNILGVRGDYALVKVVA